MEYLLNFGGHLHHWLPLEVLKRNSLTFIKESKFTTIMNLQLVLLKTANCFSGSSVLNKVNPPFTVSLGSWRKFNIQITDLEPTKLNIKSGENLKLRNIKCRFHYNKLFHTFIMVIFFRYLLVWFQQHKDIFHIFHELLNTLLGLKLWMQKSFYVQLCSYT